MRPPRCVITVIRADRVIGADAVRPYRGLMHRYQIEVAQRIVESVTKRQGHTFVVVFPRQSGKNELQAQLETYLLVLYWYLDGELVKVSPTWKPQSLNAMRRLTGW